MKRYNYFITLCICALAFFNTNDAYAKGEVTFYAKLKTQVASSCANMGKVYAGTSNSAGTYNASSSTSGELNSGEQASGTTEYTIGTFYAFAQENSGYKFKGWKVNDDANAVFVSTANPYSLTIKSTSQTSGSGTQKVLYAFFEETVSVNITFIGDAKGSYQYTISSTTSTVDGSNKSEIDVEQVTLSAPSAKSGYAFAGFYQINTDGTTTDLAGENPSVTFTESGSISIGARFVSTSLPKFLIKETSVQYYGLKAACAAATIGQTIVPVSDATLDGEDLLAADNGVYTIPSGVTLLIPYDAANTVEKDQPTSVDPANASNCKPYRTLTLANGITLNVSGAISVATKQYATNTTYTQTGVRTYYGFVYLNVNSKIVLNSGGILYAWGYISGDGEVVANNGSTVYEMFQFQDFRGGKRTSGMAGNSYKVFPFQQYYIQNIESKLTLEYGATEYVRMIIYMDSKQFPNTVKLVGTEGAMFTMSGGSGRVTKQYERATDRMHYTFSGTASLSSISLTFTYIISVTVNSKDYVLPINNNMTIDILSGTTFNMTQDISILPGAEINIESGAKVVIPSDKNLYVYDKAEWIGKGCCFSSKDLKQLAHVGKNNNNEYGAPLTRSITKSAKIKVDGTLEVSGSLYTTATGADICSSNAGVVNLKAKVGSKTKTYQDKGNDNYQEIPITASQLHNADGSYLATSGAAANTTISYANGHWGWMEIWKDEDGTVLKALNTCTQQSGTTPSDPSQPCKTFAGWSTKTDTPNQEVIHTATYSDTPITYDIDYSAGAHGTGTVAGGTKTCGEDFTLSSSTFTRDEYVQTGWSTSDGGEKAYELGGAYTNNADITLYPFWTEAEASVTVESEDPTCYTTVAKAITAANGMTNPIVKILKSANITSEITISAAMTIDLNGKTITATQASATGVFNINASGKTITIKDSGTGGKIDHTASYSGKLYGINFTAGSLNIIGGTIYAKNTTTANNTNYRAYGIYTSSASAITMSGGAIEAHTPNNPSAFGIYASNACEFTMTDGTIRASGTSSVRGVYLQGTTNLSNNARITASATGENCYTIFAKAGTMTINNGTYAAEGTDLAYVIFFEAGKVTVNGGKFNGSTCELTKRNTAYNVTLQGGVYVHETDLTAKCATNFYKFDLTAAEKAEVGNEYNYKVDEAYTVTFKDGDKKTIQSGLVEKNTTPVYSGETPTKTADAQYTYTFDGWSETEGGDKLASLPVVSKDATYFAHYTSTLNTYTVRWENHNEDELETDLKVAYGATPTYNSATPAHEVDPEYNYKFDGWTPEISPVTGDVTYTATYTFTKKKYTITWKDMALTTVDHVIKKDTLEWHNMPSFNYKKQSDESYSYVFLGWSPEVTLVEGNATYVAQYNAVPKNMIVEDNDTIPGNVEVVTTTVKVSGHLTINEGAKLTTNDLILEASGTGSGDINGADRVQLRDGGKAYFDYTFDVDPWHWSAFGVPFEIDLKAAAPLKETTTPMVLGSDYDIVYYDSDERAAHGPSSKCWKYVEYDAERKLTPGKLYMIAFNRPVGHVKVVRFTKAAEAAIDFTASVALATNGTGDDNNWNGIANPRMYHALLDAGVTECQVHDGGEIGKDGYHTYIMDNRKFFVGKAAFVQVPNEQQSVMTTTQATDQNAIVKKAPRRAKTAEGADRYDVQIAPMAEEMSDRVFLLTDEDKADEYVIVSDLAKAGVSPVRPQMWVNRYGVKLCKNTVAMRENIADYPLGISVPADGSYDIFLEERPNNDDMLYLTYDGEAIWNLSYGACTIDLQRGTTDHYGLRVVAKTPQVATGIEETTIQNGDAVRKVIVEDKVFIIRNGQIFGIDGRLAK